MSVVKRKYRLFPAIAVLSALLLGTLLMIHSCMRFLEHDHQALRVMSEGRQGSFNGGRYGKTGGSAGLDTTKESYVEKNNGDGGTIHGMDDGASVDSWTREEDGWRVDRIGGGKETIHEQLLGTKSTQRVFKFFDAGDAYHDMNLTCPVAWVRYMYLSGIKKVIPFTCTDTAVTSRHQPDTSEEGRTRQFLCLCIHFQLKAGISISIRNERAYYIRL